jgi:hypothetical protein
MWCLISVKNEFKWDMNLLLMTAQYSLLHDCVGEQHKEFLCLWYICKTSTQQIKERNTAKRSTERSVYFIFAYMMSHAMNRLGIIDKHMKILPLRIFLSCTRDLSLLQWGKQFSSEFLWLNPSQERQVTGSRIWGSFVNSQKNSHEVMCVEACQRMVDHRFGLL